MRHVTIEGRLFTQEEDTADLVEVPGGLGTSPWVTLTTVKTSIPDAIRKTNVTAGERPAASPRPSVPIRSRSTTA